jgi:hypothetical protein
MQILELPYRKDKRGNCSLAERQKCALTLGTPPRQRFKMFMSLPDQESSRQADILALHKCMHSPVPDVTSAKFLMCELRKSLPGLQQPLASCDQGMRTTHVCIGNVCSVNCKDKWHPCGW